jgi:hypothetical protein
MKCLLDFTQLYGSLSTILKRRWLLNEMQHTVTGLDVSTIPNMFITSEEGSPECDVTIHH